MAYILAVLLMPIVPVVTYILVIKKDAFDGKKLPWIRYVLGVLFGMTACTLCIMILELTWDRFFKPVGEETLFDDVISSFLRAALIEEAMKMVFSMLYRKMNKGQRRIEFILLAGTIGIGYGFIEKMVIGNPMAIIVNIVLPFHMLFQFLMGNYLYEAKVCKEQGNKKGHAGALLKAYFLPFLVHGTWDTLLSGASWITTQEEPEWMQYLGVGCLAVLFIGGAIIGLLSIKKVIKIAKSEPKTEIT